MLSLVALLGWPIVVLAFFATLRPSIAFLASVIGGYLLLPTQTSIDLPMLPAIDKGSVPIVSAIIVWALRSKASSPSESQMPGWLPSGPALWLLLLGLFSAIGIAATNGDVLRYGPTVLPGMRPYDAASLSLGFGMTVLVLLAARRFLGSPDANRDLLVVLCIAGLAYSFLALFEVRMSPQLNNWVYGFFPHSWLQHYRYGGWRPVVFVEHGLWLSIFFAATVLAAIACFRATPGPSRTRFLLAAIWLFGTLVLTKSLGALLLASLFSGVILLFPVRLQIVFAAAVTSVILLYPFARAANLIPIQSVLSVAEGINPERAGSLRFRLDQEDLLLAKAKERPVFGWGIWSRSRVFDQEGRDTSITDGAWVITFGVGGWTRYIAIYGLLGLPVLLIFLRQRHRPVSQETAAIAIIMTANLVDTIPNGTITPITWLLAGALWGRLEWQGAGSPEAAGQVSSTRGATSRSVSGLGSTSPKQGPVYTRQTAKVDRKQRPAH